MTRKKVTLAYITNDSARKATFKKRKKGLLKKVSELSMLCGIEACAIIYSGYDSEPVVWPSAAGAHHVIAKFRNMPEMDQSKRMMNQMAFLTKRILKVEEQLRKQQRDNRENEVTQVMQQAIAQPGLISLHGMTLLDLNDLNWVIEKTIKEIDERVTSLKNNPPPPPPPPPSQNKNNNIGIGLANGNSITGLDNTDNNGNIAGGNAVRNGEVQNQSWYMEFLKPNAGLAEFSGFGNNDNIGMNVMAPGPLAFPSALPPPYPRPSGQNGAASWSNYFLP